MKLLPLLLLALLASSYAPRITINATDGQVSVSADRTVTVTPSIKADGNTVTPKLTP